MEGYTSLIPGDKTGYGRFDCDVLHGLIDSDYRGVVGVIVNNHGRAFRLPERTRIAQMVIRKVEDVEFTEVAQLSHTERENGGFGHSNDKEI